MGGTPRTHALPNVGRGDREELMSGVVRAGRLGGQLRGRVRALQGRVDVLTGLGSQQVARRNAALASASLLRRREEREQVEAFLTEYAAGGEGDTRTA